MSTSSRLHYYNLSLGRSDQVNLSRRLCIITQIANRHFAVVILNIITRKQATPHWQHRMSDAITSLEIIYATHRSVSCTIFIYTFCVYWSCRRRPREPKLLIAESLRALFRLAPFEIRLASKMRSRHDFRYEYGRQEISQREATEGESYCLAEVIVKLLCKRILLRSSSLSKLRDGRTYLWHGLLIICVTQIISIIVDVVFVVSALIVLFALSWEWIIVSRWIRVDSHLVAPGVLICALVALW